MPRDHARIQTAIWRNKDFRALTKDSQHMYFVLLSQPSLSYCGVLDWWPNRLANLSDDGDETAVFAAVKELIEAKFIGLDVTTSELLIRTYVRHDGVLNRKNMGKAMGRALEQVVSLDVHHSVVVELARLYNEDPNLTGWEGFEELYPDDYDQVLSMASAMA